MENFTITVKKDDIDLDLKDCIFSMILKQGNNNSFEIFAEGNVFDMSGYTVEENDICIIICHVNDKNYTLATTNIGSIENWMDNIRDINFELKEDKNDN